MTPEEIKRKYQDLLNNEIFLADPISWMQNDSEFIVMTALSDIRAVAVTPRLRCARSRRASRPR
jgi:hypothetical protein